MNLIGKHLHSGHHAMQYLCGAAVVLVIAAVVLGAPALALVGGLFCAAMMIGMVWMMVVMGMRRGK
jgi:hypothetical protein